MINVDTKKTVDVFAALVVDIVLHSIMYRWTMENSDRRLFQNFTVRTPYLLLLLISTRTNIDTSNLCIYVHRSRPPISPFILIFNRSLL